MSWRSQPCRIVGSSGLEQRAQTDECRARSLESLDRNGCILVNDISNGTQPWPWERMPTDAGPVLEAFAALTGEMTGGLGKADDKRMLNLEDGAAQVSG